MSWSVSKIFSYRTIALANAAWPHRIRRLRETGLGRELGEMGEELLDACPRPA
jgi:hypothetical protein